MADAFDPQHAGRLEDPARLEALPQETVVSLLRLGGAETVVDWGDRERPVGPPLDHVLGLAAVRAIISEMGLEELEAHEPGTELPYHLVVVAAKP